MKKMILLLLFISICFLGNAVPVLKTVSNLNAGKLSTHFNPEELTTVNTLTITGILDATDFKFLRDQLTSLYSLNIREVRIAAYNGTEGTKGSSMTNYPADALPKHAFYFASNNTGKQIGIIMLPNTITTIDTLALKKTNLSNIKLPNSVTTINYMGIQGIDALKNITLSSNLTTIGVSAFSYNRKLTTITIPASVKTIGNCAFESCLVLANVSMLSNKPIALTRSNDIFKNIDPDCTLNVPTEAIAAYKKALVWKDFATIQGVTEE